jgi:hypothetical protein
MDEKWPSSRCRPSKKPMRAVPGRSRAGMTAADQMIAEHLRKRNKRHWWPTRSTTST